MQHASTTYDLFLSHRGPDTKDLCSFLKEALHRAAVHAFLDEHDLKVGDPNSEPAWTSIRNALQGADLVMPIITEGFFDSPWCLDELVLMMQSPAKVMPVFLDFDPSKTIFVDLLAGCAAPLRHARTCAWNRLLIRRVITYLP